MQILLFVLLLAGKADPALVGSWGLNGQPFLTFSANGKGDMQGESFGWSTAGGVVTFTSPGDPAEAAAYQVQGDQLQIVMGGIPMALTRIGGRSAPSKVTAAPDPAPAKSASSKGPPAAKDKLSQLLVSSAWCSFSYSGGGSYSTSYDHTSQSRVVFNRDGTYSATGGSESSNSGGNGSYYGSGGTSLSGRWQVKGSDLWLSNPPQTPELQKASTIQVEYNSNGYPILKANGTEYMMCN